LSQDTHYNKLKGVYRRLESFAKSYLKPLNINASWQFPVTDRVQKKW
jgi:hypothetical protein